MNERDKSTPTREAFPNPNALQRERDQPIVRIQWRCKQGHFLVVEGGAKPTVCPTCTSPKDS